MTMYYKTHCLDNKVNKMSVDSETSIFVEKLHLMRGAYTDTNNVAFTK